MGLVFENHDESGYPDVGLDSEDHNELWDTSVDLDSENHDEYGYTWAIAYPDNINPTANSITINSVSISSIIP